MIQETAIVTRVEGGQVWIKPQPAGACGGCLRQAACGTATLAKLLPAREFAVDCEAGLQPGDQVIVAVDDSRLLLGSLLLYLLPLLPMLIGVGLADVFMPSAIADAWLPEIALALLLSAFWLIHHFQAFLLLHICFKPQIIGSA